MQARKLRGTHHPDALQAHRSYLRALHREKQAYEAALPHQVKAHGAQALWKAIHPKATAGPSPVAPQAHHAHCEQLFDLPADAMPPCCPRVVVQELPLTGTHVWDALQRGFRATCSQGASPLPTQLLRHLGAPAAEVLSRLFQRIAAWGIPAQWREVQVCPVFKHKGDPRAASNYRTVAVASPLPKLYMSCFNRHLTQVADSNNWRAATQVGFRPKHRLEDLIILADFLVDRAMRDRQPLAIAFIDLKKAFDRVPRARLL